MTNFYVEAEPKSTIRGDIPFPVAIMVLISPTGGPSYALSRIPAREEVSRYAPIGIFIRETDPAFKREHPHTISGVFEMVNWVLTPFLPLVSKI